jgi:hypothetical protein
MWGPHSGAYKDSVESQPTFQRNVVSILSVEEEAKKETAEQTELCLPHTFMLVSCLAYSMMLKMEATSSSEMLL